MRRREQVEGRGQRGDRRERGHAHPAREVCGDAFTASVGVTVAKPREAISALMARADEALYSAKQGGGSCSIVREPEAK